VAIGILGKKVGMTQVFKEDGSVMPVTVIEAGPCRVLQLKTPEVDGYRAVQLGFGDKKVANVNKPALGHFKRAGSAPNRFLRELRTQEADRYEVGQEIKVDIFGEGDFVDVIGISIGKGFQGGMKRWGWKGGPASHGSMFHRRIGSVGASSFPSRIFKGHHMPGRMGGERKTIQNLKVVKVDPVNNLLLVSGPVPGPRNSYLIIRNARKRPDVQFLPKETKAEEKKEPPKEPKEAEAKKELEAKAEDSQKSGKAQTKKPDEAEALKGSKKPEAEEKTKGSLI